MGVSKRDFEQFLGLEEDEHPYCYWCEREFKDGDKVFADEWLTSIFGYLYCSQECYDNHIASK